MKTSFNSGEGSFERNTTIKPESLSTLFFYTYSVSPKMFHKLFNSFHVITGNKDSLRRRHGGEDHLSFSYPELQFGKSPQLGLKKVISSPGVYSKHVGVHADICDKTFLPSL